MSEQEQLFLSIKEKSKLKQKVFCNTIEVFNDLKKIIELFQTQANEYLNDEHAALKYEAKGDFEAQLKIAGDLLFFNMHSNVFTFDKSHFIWKNSFIEENEENAYCGVIYIYNFLADSFKYDRLNDVGYLIGRIFVNKDKHFFVEGKRQLGFLYNDFKNNYADEISLKAVLQSAIMYSMSFDLLTPPYQHVQQLSVVEMMQWSNNIVTKTGKRVGFKFQKDSDIIE